MFLRKDIFSPIKSLPRSPSFWTPSLHEGKTQSKDRSIPFICMTVYAIHLKVKSSSYASRSMHSVREMAYLQKNGSMFL